MYSSNPLLNNNNNNSLKKNLINHIFSKSYIAQKEKKSPAAIAPWTQTEREKEREKTMEKGQKRLRKECGRSALSPHT